MKEVGTQAWPESKLGVDSWLIPKLGVFQKQPFPLKMWFSGRLNSQKGTASFGVQRPESGAFPCKRDSIRQGQ